MANKGLPEGWKWVSLKDASNLIGDGLHGTPKYTDDGEYYFINGNNLVDGKIIFKESTKRINFDEYQKHKKALKSSTILISINGTLGNTAFYNQEKVILGKSACYVTLSDEADKYYVRYILTSRIFINYALKNANGSTIPNVSLKAMREFQIPLPPLSTQQAIVFKIEELFSELDKGVENLKTAQQQLKVYRQAVLKWAFKGKLTNGINQDAKEFSDDHKLAMVAEPNAVYKTAKSLNHDFNDLPDDHDLESDTNIASAKNQENQANQKNQGADNERLPEGWKWVKISEIANINPKIPNREHIPEDLEVQFLPMKLVEAISNKIHLEEVRLYKDVIKGSYTPFINGDIIFAKVTPCMENGKIAVVNKLKNNIGFGSSEFHVIRCNADLNNSYAFYFLVQDFFRNHAANAMTGAVGLRRVPKQFIENFDIPVPPIKEQTQIVQEIEKRLSVADKMEESIQQSLLQAESLRQSILKKAFEGKLIM